MLNIKLMVILMAILFTKESSQCDHGEVRIVPVSRTLNHGGVEICIDSKWGTHWGTVCRNGWDRDAAALVCNQLGYGRDGVYAFWIEDWNSGPILVDKVNCDSSDTRLVDCHYRIRSGDNSDCDYAGVRCNGERLRAQNVNVSATTVNTTQNVMVSWELYGNAPHEPSSLRVRCYNQQRAIEFSLWMNNETLTHVSVGGVLSSVSFACCVSITYYYYRGYYEAERKCASTNMLLPDSYIISGPVTTPSSTQMIPASIGSENISSDLNMRASIVGGVLGSIIIILLLLLAMCGGALLFLLRSKNMTPKTTIDNNSRYVTSSTSGLQTQGTDASAAAADYSRIGPYETIDSRRQHQPEAGGQGNVATLASLSERYEFSEPHLAMATSARPGGDRGGGVGQGEAAALDYEVPLTSSLSQSEGHEAYSHLQHRR